MSEPIVRPLFFEGQILAAADLTAVVDHARGEAARDRRDLHTTGIATGLVLSGKPQSIVVDGTPQTFEEVTLSAGVAVDRTGRQVVLAADTRLDETLFAESGVQVADPAAWYPVFLRGVDTAAPVPPATAGACGTTGATRVVEDAEISFGPPGQELDLDADSPPAPADGPGDPRGALLLLGFVQWDGTRFQKVSLKPLGIGPRYAGALADEVVARAGVLSLRSRAGAGKPALVLDEADGGHLAFGLQDARGRVTPALTVDARGNLTVQGKIVSAVAPGEVRVQSGVVSDGVILPLPLGISEQDVAAEKVVLHVHLTPRPPGALPPSDTVGIWLAAPLECAIEPVSRRVLCRFRWLSTSGTVEDYPGACDYLVMATLPQPAGGQP